MTPDIVKRLTAQLIKKGMSKQEAARVAVSHLQASGILHKGSTTLTDRGVVRNNMTASDRAKDRASTYSGNYHPPSAYSKLTDVAHLTPGPAVKVTKVRKSKIHSSIK